MCACLREEYSLRTCADLRAHTDATPHAHDTEGAHQDALTDLARENLLLKHQLNAASAEVDRLKGVLQAYDISQEVKAGSNGKGQSRYWTEEEHQRFLDAIQNYGHKDVKAIASVVGTRNATQVCV